MSLHEVPSLPDAPAAAAQLVLRPEMLINPRLQKPTPVCVMRALCGAKRRSRVHCDTRETTLQPQPQARSYTVEQRSQQDHRSGNHWIRVGTCVDYRGAVLHRRDEHRPDYRCPETAATAKNTRTARHRCRNGKNPAFWAKAPDAAEVWLRQTSPALLQKLWAMCTSS